tara:strand:+ start:2057 stop:2317 length:261 start_codon:yes stop_codon:yes gene_type:complete
MRSKKSIHINIDPEIHAGFRIQCFQHGLSMQEVFAAFAEKVATESNEMITLLEDVAKNKKVRKIKKRINHDVETIFDLLEEDDPLR